MAENKKKRRISLLGDPASASAWKSDAHPILKTRVADGVYSDGRWEMCGMGRTFHVGGVPDFNVATEPYRIKFAPR